MIELEIQALSERREGLLIEVGRFVIANGFVLQRQRLTQDPHGILLTIVVRGPARKKRSLEAALEGYERFISFDVSPFVEGEPKPHFAASRKGVSDGYIPPPAPAQVPVSAPLAVATTPEPPRTVAPVVVAMPPEPLREPEPAEFMQAAAPMPPPAPAPAEAAPFVELVPLAADEAAVEKALRDLSLDYPQIVPRLLTLERSVVEGARKASIALAGQRTGAWIFERDYATGAKLDLREAIERIGVPALRALVEVEQDGSQLHIHNSPLCTHDSHSGCTFFSGFLEGLLGPALVSNELSIFPVCCRSYGADDCVLALSD